MNSPDIYLAYFLTRLVAMFQKVVIVEDQVNHFFDEDFSLENFLKDLRQHGIDPTIVELPITPEQEKSIRDKLNKHGGADNGYCAVAVCDVIYEICGIDPDEFPAELEENAKKAKNCK